MATGGPPIPATTLVAALTTPAATAPARPRAARRRSPAARSATATSVTTPAATSSVRAGTRRTPAANSGVAASAGTSSHRASRGRASRRWRTSMARLSTPDRRIAVRTPSRLPSTATRTGAHTSAKPIPLIACTAAPAATASAANAVSFIGGCPFSAPFPAICEGNGAENEACSQQRRGDAGGDQGGLLERAEVGEPVDRGGGGVGELACVQRARLDAERAGRGAALDRDRALHLVQAGERVVGHAALVGAGLVLRAATEADGAVGQVLEAVVDVGLYRGGIEQRERRLVPEPGRRLVA